MSGSFGMCLIAHRAIGLIVVHCRTECQAQHAAYLVVKLFGAYLATLYALEVWLRHVVHVVGVAGTFTQAICPRAKFEVEAVADGFIGRVRASPVRYYSTIETPIIFEYFVE